MIVNIRGANGAGKTHLVRELIKLADAETVVQSIARPGPPRVLGHILSHGEVRTFVVGDYTQPGSGGCDKLKTVADVITLIEEGDLIFHNVVFEGILISTTFGAVGEWARQCRDRFAVLHLATSVDECLANIVERRKLARVVRDKPMDRGNIVDKDRAVRSACEKFRAEGFRVVAVPGRGALPYLLGMISLMDLDTGELHA